MHCQLPGETPTTLQEDGYHFPPEYGKSKDDNFVFRIRLPHTLGVLIWTTVDKIGHKPAYCYCVE
jgi:hypothetical protein